MSSSKSQLDVPEISEGSSVTELISILRCSFQQKEYDKVERLLICREEKLEMELKNLRRDFDFMKQQRDSLEKAHGISELDRLMIEEEVTRCKHDYEESREQLNRLRSDNEVLIGRVRSAECRYKCVAEELKKVENEHRTARSKMIEELAKKNEELDELRTERNEMVEKLISKTHDAEDSVPLLHSHLQTFVGRVSILEENVAKLLDVDALHVRRGIYFQEVDMEAEGSFLLSSAAMESSVNGGLSGGSAFEGESGGFNVKNMRSGANDHGEAHVLLRPHLPYNATGTENPDLPGRT